MDKELPTPDIRVTKKKGPSRKKLVPIWRDPHYNDGDFVISWYIPLMIPEEATKEDPLPMPINAELIMKAVLPKHMTRFEFQDFREMPEGQEWFKKQIELAKKKMDKLDQN